MRIYTKIDNDMSGVWITTKYSFRVLGAVYAIAAKSFGTTFWTKVASGAMFLYKKLLFSNYDSKNFSQLSRNEIQFLKNIGL